jgi:hypothetical protein
MLTNNQSSGDENANEVGSHLQDRAKHDASHSNQQSSSSAKHVTNDEGAHSADELANIDDTGNDGLNA